MNLTASIVGIGLAVVASACGGTSTYKTEKIEGVEWNVTVKPVVHTSYNDGNYTVADTARINEELKDVSHCGNVCFGWTLPSADGTIWLVAYENEPLLSERVSVTDANTLPSYGGNIQVAFKFMDASEWAKITRSNIGNRLAVFVNGQLMNAPQVNAAITSGNCSVSIPEDMIHDFLPDLDLEKLKQQ